MFRSSLGQFRTVVSKNSVLLNCKRLKTKTNHFVPQPTILKITAKYYTNHVRIRHHSLFITRGGRILEGFHGLHEERRDQVSPTVGTIENWLPMRAVHKNEILFSLARQGVLWISFFPSVCFTEKKTLSISSSCCCWISACFTVLTIARCSSSLVEKCLVQHPAAKTYTQSCQSRVHGGAEIGTCRLKECYRFFL